MTTPTSTPEAPVSAVSPSQLGLCARCQAKTHRYGPNGNPLCPPCLAAARAQQGKKSQAVV